MELSFPCTLSHCAFINGTDANIFSATETLRSVLHRVLIPLAKSIPQIQARLTNLGVCRHIIGIHLGRWSRPIFQFWEPNGQRQYVLLICEEVRILSSALLVKLIRDLRDAASA